MALLSDIRSGLLGAGQAVGRGVGQAASLLGESVREPLAQGVANIPDVMRFYEAQRMSQPMMAYDPAELKPVSPAGVVGMLPQLRAAEQESLLKPETERMRQGLLRAQREEAEASAKKSLSLLSSKRTKAKNVNIMLPDGTVTYGVSDDFGNLTLPDGSRAPQGSRVFGTSISAAKIGDIAPKDVKALDEFQKLSSNAQTFFNSGNKLLRGLEENKPAATLVGTLAGVGSKVYQNVEAFADAFGVPKENLANVDNVFQEYSIDSAKMKSQILDLAYQAARIRGQEGRGLSDRDVAIFSQIIGSNQSPSEKAGVLRDYMDTISREVGMRAEFLSEQSGQQLRVPQLTAYRPQPVTPSNDDAVEEVYEYNSKGELVRTK